MSTHHLGAILSVTTGKFLCTGGIGDLYSLLNHMTSDDLFTHQLVRASEECKPHLLAQFPQLADVPVPAEFADEAHVWRWLAEQCDTYGTWFEVKPLAAGDHTVIDPIAELKMLRPDMPIVTFEAQRDGGDN